jgi:hypothetical protein
MAVIPNFYYVEAGAYATTLNYVWPLALGLYILTKINALYQREKVSIKEYILSFFALLYASNQEQMVALLIGFTIVYLIRYYYKYKTISPYMIVVFVFLVSMLLFHLTCPGNNARLVHEILNFYPEYATFTMTDKLILGITSMSRFILMRNPSMVVFLLVLTSFTIYRCKSIVDCILTGALFINTLVISLPFIAEKVPIINNLYHALRLWETPVTSISENKSAVLLAVGYLFIALGIVVYSLIKYIHGDAFWVIIIILACMASKVIVGFSPTIFASGSRTVIFSNYGIIVATVYCFKKQILEKDKFKKYLI